MKKLEELKASLIAEVDKRMADKIIEHTNAELLVKLINNAESETEALAIAELGTTYRRTGFHFDKRLEKMGSDIKYFAKNKDLSFVSDKDALTHKLIIGDNYNALLNLLISHKGKIDVIYIDPPYGKDSMGKFADTNYINALTRDNLLSMLYPRLQLAKYLLSDDGIIYCSIDDRNMAYIKCLFDEIFGENNFICNFVWEKNLSPSNLSRTIRDATEYVITYAKQKENIELLDNLKDKKDNFSLYNKTNSYKELVFNKDKVIFEIPDGVYKPAKFETTELLNEIVVKDGKANVDIRIGSNFVWKQDTLDSKSEETIFYIKTKKFVPRGVGINKKTTVRPLTLLYGEKVGTTLSSNGEIKKIFGDTVFDYTKPTSLIKYLISICSKKDSIVFDFFAGSGTTGQAVLDLNKEDGGNRQFILCTNNEEEDGYIAEKVTSKRLKRVMTGCCYDGTLDFKWNDENSPLGDNLDVYDIKSVNNSEIREGKSAFEVIDETLYDLPKFESIEEKINWICSNFENTQRYIEGE